MLTKLENNLEKLWEDIRLVYEGFNFNNLMRFDWNVQGIDGLMIISHDNYYLLQYKKDLEPLVHIKIEKHYRLANIIGNGGNTTSYNITVQVGDSGYKYEDQMIDFTYIILTPFLREIKINKLID